MTHTIDFDDVIATLNEHHFGDLCEKGIEDAAAFFGLPHKDKGYPGWGHKSELETVEPYLDTDTITDIAERLDWSNDDSGAGCYDFYLTDNDADLPYAAIALVTEILGLTELEGVKKRKRKKAT